MSYQYRYPPAFDKFTDRQGVPAGVSDAQVPIYNTYDNAVLYNDFVVSSLIKDFAKTDPNGFLLYLSDHGEDVYDGPNHDVLGRNEAKPTAPMYTVPFLVYASQKWRQTHNWDFTSIKSRPFSSSSLIHTWAQLAGLSFDELDGTKSLVSFDFKERPRLIGDPYQEKGLTDFSLMRGNTPPALIAPKVVQQ
jgi:heptose-I-phosphate ethanolaminephosphotransferase